MVPKQLEPDRIKIGISHDVKKRKRQVEAASGQVLVCIAAVQTTEDFARKIEKTVHAAFKEFRIRGEWFKCVPEIFEFPSYLEACGFNVFEHDCVEFKARGDVSHLSEPIQRTLADREAVRV